jgi:hypothetical protein
LAALIAGKAAVTAVLTAVASAVLLWGLYFAVGFWSFSRGRQANGLWSLLTLGIPTVSIVLVRGGWPGVAALTPSGNVWHALAIGPTSIWLIGALILGSAALILGASAQRSCDRDLRLWYDRNAGLQALD